MQFAVRMFERSCPDVLLLADDMPDVSSASRESLDVVREELHALDKEVGLTGSLVKEHARWLRQHPQAKVR